MHATRPDRQPPAAPVSRRQSLRLLGLGLLAGGVTPLLAACAPGAAPAPTAAPTRPAAAASPSPLASPAAGGAFTVTMTSANRYEPPTLTVPRGASVTWRNTGSIGHTVTDDPAKAQNRANAALPAGAQPWDSGTIAGGQSFTRTFDTPGDYTYFCIPHESVGMVGKLTVTG